MHKNGESKDHCFASRTVACRASATDTQITIVSPALAEAELQAPMQLVAGFDGPPNLTTQLANGKVAMRFDTHFGNTSKGLRMTGQAIFLWSGKKLLGLTEARVFIGDGPQYTKLNCGNDLEGI